MAATVEVIGSEHIDGSVARAVVEQSPHCVKLVDAQGRLRYMSENGLCAMEIDEVADVAGEEWWKLWPAPSEPVLRHAVEAGRRGLSTHFEAFCPTARGNPRWWSVTVSPIRGGEFDGFLLATSEDVTKHREAEREQRRRVLETRALHQLTRMVAHGLRNPVRHVLLLGESTSAALEEGDLAGSRSSLAQLQGVARSLSHLVDRFERLAAVQTASETPSWTELAWLVESTADALQLVLHTDLAPVEIFGREAGWCLALQHLLENAVMHHPDRAPQVMVVAEVCGPALHIDVWDDGPGFPDEADDLFSPFRRGGFESDHGLGLAIVRSVVRDHGGDTGVLPNDGNPIEGCAGRGAGVRLIVPHWRTKEPT